MAYSKQNFSSKSILYASQLNNMDNQISTNESSITSIQSALDDLNNMLSSSNSSISTLQSSLSTANTNITNLATRVSDLESNEEGTPPRAYLTKTQGQILCFYVENMPAGNYTLHFVRKSIRNRTTQWRPLEELSSSLLYDTIPEWMSNGGNMPSTIDFSITSDGGSYTTLWSATKVIGNMVKANNETDLTNASGLYLIGVSKSRPYHSIPISFYVTKENETQPYIMAENAAYVFRKGDGMTANSGSLIGLGIQIR